MGVHPDPPRGRENQSSEQETKETQSGLKGPLPKEGQPTSSKNQEDLGTVESLNFLKELCNIEDSLLVVFNKLKDVYYINGIVNLSSYTLTNSATIVYSQKGWVIAPLEGLQTLVISFKIWCFQKKNKTELVFLRFQSGLKRTEHLIRGSIWTHRVNLYVNNMLQWGQISQNSSNYLTTDIDRTQQFYLLPKIPGSGGPTEKISQLVDHFTGPLVPLSESCIRDSTHMINILNKFSMLPDMILHTLDITRLYINIPHNEGIQSIEEF